MPNRTLEIKVGVAVSIGLVLFLITIFMLGQDSSLFARTYRLYVAFDKIEGLAPGGLVRLSGLRVGNVEDIEFSEEKNVLQVVLKIELKYQNRITKGAKASIRTQGALGDKYILIEPGPSDTLALNDEDWIDAEVAGDILSTLSTRGNDLEKIFDILNELQIFTKNLNENNRSQRIAENLAGTAEQLNHLLKNLSGEDKSSLKAAVVHLNSILEKIDRGEGTLGALINDPSIHEKIKSFLGTTPRNQYMNSAIQKTIQQSPK